MALLDKQETPLFTEGVITRGTLVRAWHYSWDGPRNGIVFAANEREVSVMFMPGVHSAYAYFIIKASEVANNDWTLTYTQDFETIDGDTKMDDYKRLHWKDLIDGIKAVKKEEVDGVFADDEASFEEIEAIIRGETE